MYICNCNGVSETDVARSIEAGHTTLRALRDTLGVGSCCGKCVCDVRRHLKAAQGCGEHACAGTCASASRQYEGYSAGVAEPALC